MSLFFLFWVLELWVYLSGFADPSRLCYWEGPLSLLIGVCGYSNFYKQIREKRPRLAGLLALAPPVGLFLLCVPLMPVSESEWRIEVEKSTRTLSVYRADRRVGRYSIALGGNSLGDKEFMGDQETPLGDFRVVDKGPSTFHKWLGLNYPTSEDALRGRLEGRIMWAEMFYILLENRNGRIPYGNSALGGAIGIHGGGAGKDWTLGCIALENTDIDQFYQHIPIGTKVLIRP